MRDLPLIQAVLLPASATQSDQFISKVRIKYFTIFEIFQCSDWLIQCHMTGNTTLRDLRLNDI